MTAGLGATLASRWVEYPVALALFGALLVGLRRVVGGPTEIACDAAGARAVGHVETARALEKIHAAHWLKGEGFVPTVARAMATHPARSLRVAAIWRRASSEERAKIPLDEREVTRDRLARGAALGLWLVAIAGALALGPRGVGRAREWAAVAGLVAVTLTPSVLLRRAIRREVRRARARLGVAVPRAWPTFLVLGSAILAVVGVYQLVNLPPGMVEGDALIGFARSLGLLALGFVGIVVGGKLGAKRPTAKLEAEVAELFRLREFSRARKLLEEKATAVSGSLLLRYYRASLEALTDDRARAVQTLEQLEKDTARFPAATMLFVKLALDDDPPRALALAATLEKALPDDPVAAYWMARALRRAGDRAAAEAALARGFALEPEDESLLALGAELALDAGDVDRARRLVARSLERSPANPLALLARARIALETEPRERAQAALDEVTRASEAAPFGLLQRDIQALRSRLGSSDPAGGLAPPSL